MKTLFLEKRGCNFCSNEQYKSDINNYRVTTTGEIIEGKDGNKYFLEFCLWKAKGHYRKTTKDGKRTLKKAVWEIDARNTIAINTQYTDKNGQSWANLKIEKEIHEKNLPYTKDGILEAVNTFSKVKYNKIEFV